MKNLSNKLFNFIINNKYLLLLSVFYFFLRIINLTNFPIFNDEAIYLDWGWRETHTPGFLYYSLYDAKQPLLMWIFGIAQEILSNPLFAGRIVSVLAGFMTLIGIYKISKKLFDTKTALVAMLFYTIIPLFSFYDRQALMESSISAVGIWAGYYLILFSEKKLYRYSIILGLILGIGFFIKSSAIIFLASFFITSIYLLKLSSKKGKTLENIFLTIIIFLVTILLLLINPQFWATLGLHSRFSLSLKEIALFPINIWINSTVANTRIAFFYLTPFIFTASVFAMIKMFSFSAKHKIFLLFFVSSIFIETFIAKGATDRYVVAFLPFLVILFSFVLLEVFKKNKLAGYGFFFLSFVIPFLLVLYQITNFAGYIKTMGKISGYSHSTYLSGFTSGYGVNEAVSYFKSLSKKEDFIIGIAENTGNPESALQVYFNKSKNPKVVYMDSKLLPVNVNDYECLSTGIKTYFVSRDNQQGGLEKFLTKIKTIDNPHGQNSIGIFKLKEGCKGKTLEISVKKV